MPAPVRYRSTGGLVTGADCRRTGEAGRVARGCDSPRLPDHIRSYADSSELPTCKERRRWVHGPKGCRDHDLRRMVMAVPIPHGPLWRLPEFFRADSLADWVDSNRSQWEIEPRGAAWLESHGGDMITGREIASRYKTLLHYTRREFKGIIGNDGLKGGCYFTPTPYSACTSVCAIGLPAPADTVVVVDPSAIDEWYGPGLAVPSALDVARDVWPGGAIEFLCLERIPLKNILHVAEMRSCGDVPWDWLLNLRSP